MQNKNNLRVEACPTRPSGMWPKPLYVCSGGNDAYAINGCVPWGYYQGAGAAGNLTTGNDMFDAISGSPGTYISINMYGQMNFGFSVDLYNAVASQGPAALNTTGWTYIIQDSGTSSVTSGFLADTISLLLQNAELASQLPPDAMSAILANVGALQNAAMRSGQSEPMQNSFWDAVGDYLQANGIDPSFQLPLYQNLWGIYQLSLSPANPLNRL